MKKKANESGMLLCRYYSQQFENIQNRLWGTFKKVTGGCPTGEQWGSTYWPSVGLRLLAVLGVLKNNYTQWLTNKGSHSRKLQDVHSLLARFQHDVDSIFWAKCGFWFELQRNLKEKRASYVQLCLFMCVWHPHIQTDIFAGGPVHTRITVKAVKYLFYSQLW